MFVVFDVWCQLVFNLKKKKKKEKWILAVVTRQISARDCFLPLFSVCRVAQQKHTLCIERIIPVYFWLLTISRDLSSTNVFKIRPCVYFSRSQNTFLNPIQCHSSWTTVLVVLAGWRLSVFSLIDSTLKKKRINVVWQNILLITNDSNIQTAPKA